jgi:flagellar biosynthesis protein FlhB
LGAAAGPRPPRAGAAIEAAFSSGMFAVAPILLATAAASVLATVVQTGGATSWHPLVPRLEHLDPAQGVRRLFSTRSLVEALKSFAKLVVVAAVLWSLFAPAVRGAVSIARSDAASAGRLAADLALAAIVRTGGALLAIGILDALYQRWQLRRDLRMTKEEVRREHRETEGDPQVKRARERLHREVAEHSILEEVRRATCVIVNPEHLAVALRYVEGESDAPQVIAKGERLVAARIVEIARQAGVPILRDVPLARALFSLEVGEEIPEALYEAVAEVLRLLRAEETSPAQE